MKANELMIGDWVYNTHNRQNEQVQEITSGLVMLDYNDLYEYDEIEPIPLTTEILKKNGFLCEQDRWWWQDFYITLASTKALTLVCNRTIQIKYVHQLQHLIRLCKIEKEIIL